MRTTDRFAPLFHEGRDTGVSRLRAALRPHRVIVPGKGVPSCRSRSRRHTKSLSPRRRLPGRVAVSGAPRSDVVATPWEDAVVPPPCCRQIHLDQCRRRDSLALGEVAEEPWPLVVPAADWLPLGARPETTNGLERRNAAHEDAARLIRTQGSVLAESGDARRGTAQTISHPDRGWGATGGGISRRSRQRRGSGDTGVRLSPAPVAGETIRWRVATGKPGLCSVTGGGPHPEWHRQPVAGRL